MGVDAPQAGLAQAFLSAVLEGSRSRAEGLVLDALDTGVGVGELHTHVVTKVQMELGRRWQIGESHVGEEHFSSRIVEDVLAQLRGRMPRAPENDQCVLLASVSGNLHDIGPRLVADHFEMSGWRTVFLGANMPSADLVRAARKFEPRLIALSVGQATNLRSAADTIAALRSELPDLVVLVGGAPFAAVDGLWKDLGADGFATDAADAVEFGKRLLSAS
ncbi:MAG: cobalamin B12-binding domain-containing protein [Planctomycetes bacterium]|nr:cobalamin B12-binding domain-containing protein [Planctomycetota bacterium]